MVGCEMPSAKPKCSLPSRSMTDCRRHDLGHSAIGESVRLGRVVPVERGVITREQEEHHVDAGGVRPAPQPVLGRVGADIAQDAPAMRRGHAAAELEREHGHCVLGQPQLLARRSPTARGASRVSVGRSVAGVTARRPSHARARAGVVHVQQHVAGGAEVAVPARDQTLDVGQLEGGGGSSCVTVRCDAASAAWRIHPVAPYSPARSCALFSMFRAVMP